MKIILIIAASGLAGALFSFCICKYTIKRLNTKIKALKGAQGQAKKKRFETSKLIIWACLIMGFAWVWCSYYLAYTDHVQIAESLSQVAVTEIIGVVLAYCVKSAVENLSKNNHWPDKPSPPDEAGASSSGDPDEPAG